ncbi:late competence development ComFB family protein [[Phormidium] sp. ETS-05]|uniref:late competence development ComFB family protein n=1 Tax=[Phormidium] sp. ETS-05 TaxID=222819 RepID=UPI001E3C0ACB|nr:late competence development ComFB family protein [[Phormidium] sp. ETS-05]
MEKLVAAEARRQVRSLPPKLIASINVEQVIEQATAYALNRLPGLYATSERGWNFQQQKAKEKYGIEIVAAVRQGLAAVQRDPLIPVWNPNEEEDTADTTADLKSKLPAPPPPPPPPLESSLNIRVKSNATRKHNEPA